MQTVTLDQLNIKQIVETLKSGGLIIFPTETVYGAGVDATSEKAIKRLSEFKKRPLGKPYSIAVADQEMAERYVTLNATAKNLYRNFLPGPVTVISKVKFQILNSNNQTSSKFQLANGVASETGTVGIRIPDYPELIKIIQALDGPITATSANPSYGKRPYSVEDVLSQLSVKQKALIDLVIDAGELPKREPSTVIDTTMDSEITLRQGDIVTRGHSSLVTTRNEEETKNFGKEMWQKYESNFGQRAIVFALTGEMGVGKTQFTKGLARAMGINEQVKSPTYSMESEYLTPTPSPNLGEGRNLVMRHVDAWRMQTPQELEELGMRGFINDKSVIVIEWADRVADIIRKYNEEAIVVWVRIEYGENINERVIEFG